MDPRRSVPGADVDQSLLGIICHGVPGGAAVAIFPPFPLPGSGSHFHGLVFKAKRRIARYYMKTPPLLARFGVVSGYVTAKRRHIRASMSYNELAIQNSRSACDISDSLIFFVFRGPSWLASSAIDGLQPPPART